MFHGHIDSISPLSIDGWAADAANPDESVDVSIHINMRFAVRITCDRPRSDLKRSGQYGSGRHGFFYEFPEPLPQDETTRVTAVFSATGAALGRGDWALDVNGPTALAPAVPPADNEPALLPAPADPRALFELLGWYDQHAGLYPLLSRLDLGDASRPQHIQYGVLGSWPDRSIPLPQGRYYPRDHLNELLLGDAFQNGLVPRFAAAYADKRRVIFVHIPKCAGTDLSNKLKTRFPWLDYNVMDADWTSKHAMFQHLSRLAVQLRFADRLFLCGHGSLVYYLDCNLIRPSDQLFTIVREPVEIMISQINYVLTRFLRDAEAGTVGADTAKWLALMGRDGLPDALSDDFVREAAGLILRIPEIVPPNPLCLWLGGYGADAATALQAIIASDIEITDMTRYNDWLTGRWGIISETRDNESTKFVNLETLPRKLSNYARTICEQDVKLYEAIACRLAQSGKLSIFGHELQ
jgi:hypothetical protein